MIISRNIIEFFSPICHSQSLAVCLTWFISSFFIVNYRALHYRQTLDSCSDFIHFGSDYSARWNETWNRRTIPSWWNCKRYYRQSSSIRKISKFADLDFWNIDRQLIGLNIGCWCSFYFSFHWSRRLHPTGELFSPWSWFFRIVQLTLICRFSCWTTARNGVVWSWMWRSVARTKKERECWCCSGELTEELTELFIFIFICIYLFYQL